jgi:hypothetical protein
MITLRRKTPRENDVAMPRQRTHLRNVAPIIGPLGFMFSNRFADPNSCPG